MAHVGNSEPLFVMDQGEAAEKAAKFRQFIAAPIEARQLERFN